MKEFIFLMHSDVAAKSVAADWERYIEKLNREGCFGGGSAIGDGECVSKTRTAPAPATISGYIRVRAEGLARARLLLDGNPVYEAGGTVEIRALDRS